MKSLTVYDDKFTRLCRKLKLKPSMILTRLQRLWTDRIEEFLLIRMVLENNQDRKKGRLIMPKARVKEEAVTEKEEAIEGMEDLDLDGLDVEELDLGDLDAALSEADITSALDQVEGDLTGSLSSEALNVIAEGVEALTRSVNDLAREVKSCITVQTESTKEMKGLLSQLKQTVASFDARLQGMETAKTPDPRKDKLDSGDVEAAKAKAESEGAVTARNKPGPKPKAAKEVSIPDVHHAKFLELAKKNVGKKAESLATQLATATKQKTADVLAFFKSQDKIDDDGKLK